MTALCCPSRQLVGHQLLEHEVPGVDIVDIVTFREDSRHLDKIVDNLVGEAPDIDIALRVLKVAPDMVGGRRDNAQAAWKDKQLVHDTRQPLLLLDILRRTTQVLVVDSQLTRVLEVVGDTDADTRTINAKDSPRNLIESTLCR